MTIARIRFAIMVLLASLTASLGVAQAPPQTATPAPAAATPVPIYDAEIVAKYPHDNTAFTEGLLWHDGALYESTGQEGQSTVRRVDLATGKVVAQRRIPAEQFGEGLALVGRELVSLTWKDGVIHRWRLRDLAPLRSDKGYPFEGWGLTRADKALVASDGSSTVRFLDPHDYHVLREIAVTLRGRPIGQINELEMVDGLIWANVWMTNYLVAIDPETGAVRKIVDCTALVPFGLTDSDAVLNGIAWDEGKKRLFVTGKLWPWLYQIRLVERPAAD